VEVAEMIRRRAVSCREVVTTGLARLDVGLPAVSVPTGVVDGLPMGIQITAGRFREDLRLEAASAVEARAPMATPIDPR
jgi:hypothetical protein